METDKAVDKNDEAMRQMLMNLHEDMKAFFFVDYDQVQWQVVSEAAQLAQTLTLMIHPELQDE